jgi:hypothetical protein
MRAIPTAILALLVFLLLLLAGVRMLLLLPPAGVRMLLLPP